MTKEKTVRNKRAQFGVAKSKLSLDINELDPKFHYRWVNDEPGRIAYVMSCGYVFVEPHEVGYESNTENKVSFLGGDNRDGSKMNTYLMKQPMEYFLEDSAALQGKVDKIDEAITGGQIERQQGDGRYIPKGGISYKPQS